MSKELKRRFDTAWNILPESVQEELHHFIRSVREAEPGKEISVRWSDGTICHSERHKFGAWFIIDPTIHPSKAWIFINSDFGKGSVTPAILTILHELAHAYEYVQDNWKAGVRSEERSEAAGWFQTAAWAARDTSGYDETNIVATMATKRALEELRKWRKSPS